MNFFKCALLFFLLTSLSFSASSQDFQYVNFNKNPREYNFKQYCEILLDGETMMKSENQGPMLFVDSNQKGTLSVSAIDRSGDKRTALKPVLFKVAIRDYNTNGIVMYSEKSFYEVQIETIMKEVGFGTEIIIIPVDKQYQLPRHKISLDGC